MFDFIGQQLDYGMIYHDKNKNNPTRKKIKSTFYGSFSNDFVVERTQHAYERLPEVHFKPVQNFWPKPFGNNTYTCYRDVNTNSGAPACIEANGGVWWEVWNTKKSEPYGRFYSLPHEEGSAIISGVRSIDGDYAGYAYMMVFAHTFGGFLHHLSYGFVNRGRSTQGGNNVLYGTFLYLYNPEKHCGKIPKYFNIDELPYTTFHCPLCNERHIGPDHDCPELKD